MRRMEAILRLALTAGISWMAVQPGFGQVHAPGLSGRWLVNPGWTLPLPDLHTAVTHPAAVWGTPVFGLYLQAEKLAWPGAPRVLQGGILLPAGPGMFTGNLQVAGVEGFMQADAGIGYARPLADWIQLGLRLGFTTARPQGYPGWRFLRADIGMQFRLHPQWRADLACWNLLQRSIGQTLPTSLPRVIRSGLSWVPSAHWAMSAGMVLEDGLAPAVTVAFQYQFQERFALQGWYVSTHLGLGLGLVYRHQMIQGRLAFGYVYPLGMTAIPGIQYIRAKKS